MSKKAPEGRRFVRKLPLSHFEERGYPKAFPFEGKVGPKDPDEVGPLRMR